MGLERSYSCITRIVEQVSGLINLKNTYFRKFFNWKHKPKPLLMIF